MKTLFTPRFTMFVASVALASLACTQDLPGGYVLTNETTATEAAPAATEAPVANDTPISAAPACREVSWFENAKSATLDVASLTSQLDRDFVLDQGGQWSQPGYTIPAGSVFWTDLFDNADALPNGVESVRTQGGWGVYYTSVNYVIPEDNGGGRFMRLCK